MTESATMEATEAHIYIWTDLVTLHDVLIQSQASPGHRVARSLAS